MSAQVLTSADSGKPTGAETPADALGVTKRMSTDTPEGKDSDDAACPVCGDTFASEHGMKIHRGHSHGPNTEVCDVCGDEFKCTPSAAKRADASLCSAECERKHRGFGEPVEFTCDWCGEEVTRQANQYEQYENNFCSDECKYEWHSTQFRGEDASQYVDGAWTDKSDIYGPGWNDNKKERVRKRDGRTCQHCGRSEQEHIAEFGFKHNIHHITPAREIKDPAERNAMENLITLCAQPCHDIWESLAPLRPQVQLPD
jgi:5-methylcytosine-specific restriction endonuclease McrA